MYTQSTTSISQQKSTQIYCAEVHNE